MALTLAMANPLNGPSLEIRGPRVTLLGGIYPLGAQATASARHWDARAAVIDTSPLRIRRVFSPVNPPRFANVVFAGGVTPFVGFRVGVSLTHGGWLRASETPAFTTDRMATETLRARLRSARGPLPSVAWHPPAVAAE